MAQNTELPRGAKYKRRGAKYKRCKIIHIKLKYLFNCALIIITYMRCYYKRNN